MMEVANNRRKPTSFNRKLAGSHGWNKVKYDIEISLKVCALGFRTEELIIYHHRSGRHLICLLQIHLK